MRSAVLRGLLLLAFGVGAVANHPTLPVPVGLDADPGDFSAARAMRLVEAWAKRPRPSGSASLHTVLDELEGHLVEVGFDIQRHEPPGRRALINLVGETPDPGPGVWLVAHSDTVREAPGAGDDGLGLAVLVETARVINVDGPMPGFNVLVTDGEELGLLGAKAFVAASPAPRLVINLEARGTEGPVYMFQTAGADGPILERWQASGCRAQATSLARAVYDLLPNDTDFTVFRAAGWWGYDFALIHGAWRYHTPDDRPEHLDPRSVQQLGDCVVGLVRAWLGQAQVGETSAPPAYAQLLGETNVVPGLVVRVVGLLLLALTPWPRRARAAAGLLTWLGGVIGAGVTSGLILALLLRSPGFLARPVEQESPEPLWMLGAAIGLLFVVLPAVVGRRWLRGAWADLHHGHAVVGSTLAAGVAVLWPQVGYVLLPGVMVTLAVLRGRTLAGMLAAVLAGLMLGPVLYAIFPALTTRMLPALSVIVTVLTGWWWTPYGGAASTAPPRTAP